MNEHTIEPATPDTDCPDWCVMHIQGRHVGELTNPHRLSKGYTLYDRPIDEGDGKVGIQLIVLDPEGQEVKISLPSAAVLAAARDNEGGSSPDPS